MKKATSAIGTQDTSASFDAVIMLTWSDWKTEPRSNRYHYSTRFAKQVPVLFVQPWAQPGALLSVESTEIRDVDIVHYSHRFSNEAAATFKELLRDRGVRRPLLWIYNTLHYMPLIDALPGSLRVFHATEDYLTPSTGWSQDRQEVADSVRRLMPSIDLLIAVSDGVLASYRKKGGYAKSAIVVENGCDAGFFFRVADRALAKISDAQSRSVAIFQGGINHRLDYDLLYELVYLLPDWNFWFCGADDPLNKGWQLLKSHPSVRHFGKVDSEQLGELMCAATVALIPFVQDEWIGNSFPLKALEYVACGLPVVSVPIEALRRFADDVLVAHSAPEFAGAMKVAAQTRFDPTALERRRRVADDNSYDRRFATATDAIVSTARRMAVEPRKLNVVLLYDDRWTHISTIREHLEAFRKYSRHHIFFIPGTQQPTVHVTDASSSDAIMLAGSTDLSLFDVLIVHYSVRLSLRGHVSKELADKIARYEGLKILFIQDEYENTETARRWMERLGIDVVYTCVPRIYVDYVYPRSRFPCTDFLATLTGYVPENPGIDDFALPLTDRRAFIGYRGRKLPYVYGMLGYEKYQIGVDVRRFARERGLPVEIELDDSQRIYGDDWYRFLGSVRATLGTESGSSIFDFDGSVREEIDRWMRDHPGAGFDELHHAVLAPYEERVRMNQVSPKIFEAIRLRTALVLFEGEYSDVVKAGRHYIPLKKDCSNIEEVFAKVTDDQYLREITDRAYEDVIESGRYSYRTFVGGVDDDIAARVTRGPRYVLYAAPVIARNTTNGEIKVVVPSNPLGYALSTGLLYGNFQREQIAEAVFMFESASRRTDPTAAPTKAPRVSWTKRAARAAWRTIPLGLRTRIRVTALRIVERGKLPGSRRSLSERCMRAAWRTALPSGFRRRVLNALRRG